MPEPAAVPDRVRIVHKDGRQGSIPAANLGKMPEGWRIETADEAAQRAFEQDRGALAPLGTAAAEGLSAATLGGSDVLGGALGGEEFRDWRRRSVEADPLAAGAGTALGIVAPAVLTGGGSAAAQGVAKGGAMALAKGAASTGARVVSAPARAAMAVGRGAETLAGKVLTRAGITGESMLGRAALGAGKLTASGAVEGAIFGAGEALSEAALAPGGDYTGLSEKLWAGAGEGAKFGALGGAVLGGLGGVGSKAVDRLLRRGGDDAARAADGALDPDVAAVIRGGDDVPKLGAGKADDAIPDVPFSAESAATFEARLQPPKPRSAEEAAAAFGPLNHSVEAKAGRRMYAEADEILETASGDMHRGFGRLIDSTKDVTDEVVHRQLKREHVARNLANVDGEAARASARSFARDLRREALEIGGKRGKDLADWSNRLAKAADGDAVDAYMALDDVRRQLYKRYQSVATSARRVTSPAKIEQAEALAASLKKSYLKAADNLMGDVWGAQGASQKAVNNAWVRYIKAKDAAFGKIATRTGKDIDGLPTYVVDSSKVSSYVRKLGRFEGQTSDEQIREFVAASRNLTEAIGEGYALPATKVNSLQALRGATDDIATSLGKADQTVRVVNEIDNLVKGSQVDAALGNMAPGSLVGTITGGVVGGIPGAAIGSVAGALLRPGSSIQRLARVESAGRSVVENLARKVDAVNSRIDSGIRRWVSGDVKRAAVRGGVALSMSDTLGQKKGEKRADAYFRKVAAVEKEANAPMRAPHPDAPETSRAMEATRKSAAQFLLDKAPMGSRRYSHPVLARIARQRPPDEGEVRRWARYVGAVENPLSVIDSLEKGTLNKQQVEALQAVYPSMYQQVRQRAVDELISHGDDMPYHDRIQLGILLGIVADPSMRPVSLRLGQQSFITGPQEQQQQPGMPGSGGGGGPDLDIASDFSSYSQELEGMEAM